MSGSTPTDSDSIRKALHKEMGVRRDGLRAFLDQWPARWKMADADDETLRAYVMWWVNEALSGLTRPAHRTIGRVAYNTTWDMDLRGLRYVERLELLQAAEGISVHTARRAVTELISERVTGCLTRHADGPSADDLAAYRDRERAYQRQPLPSSQPVLACDADELARVAAAARFQQAVRSLLGTSLDDVVGLFLSLRCHVPVWAQTPVMAKTESYGHLVYAFTSAALLRAYQEATGAWRMTDHAELTGRDLIERVRRLPVPAGIVVDPAVDESASDVAAMFVLTTSDIAGIVLPETSGK